MHETLDMVHTGRMTEEPAPNRLKTQKLLRTLEIFFSFLYEGTKRLSLPRAKQRMEPSQKLEQDCLTELVHVSTKEYLSYGCV